MTEEPTNMVLTTTTTPVTIPATTPSKTIPGRYSVPEYFELLEGSVNWDVWSFRIQKILEAEEAWNITDGTEAKPTDDEPLRVWTARDRAARITINLEISDTCIPLVRNAQSANEAWKALSDAYKAKGLLTAFDYRTQILGFKLNESIPFGPQIDQMRQLRSKQINAGIPSTDLDFAICVLAALPDSYNIIKSFILARCSNLAKIDVNSMFSLILQEETYRNGIAPNNVDSEAAFATHRAPKPNAKMQKRNGQSERPGACNWCKCEGHWEADCRKKKKSQSQAQSGADKFNRQRKDKKNRNKGGERDGRPTQDAKDGW